MVLLVLVGAGADWCWCWLVQTVCVNRCVRCRRTEIPRCGDPQVTIQHPVKLLYSKYMCILTKTILVRVLSSSVLQVSPISTAYLFSFFDSLLANNSSAYFFIFSHQFAAAFAAVFTYSPHPPPVICNLHRSCVSHLPLSLRLESLWTASNSLPKIPRPQGSAWFSRNRVARRGDV